VTERFGSYDPSVPVDDPFAELLLDVVVGSP
jgi:hypothetical protein